jgi:hypothetical protein
MVDLLGSGSAAPPAGAGRSRTGQASAGSTASMRARCASYCGGSFSASPEALHRLVDGEAGNVGGDLEQHAAGLAEIDRAEVVPVALFRDALAVVSRSRFTIASCAASSAARKAM